jgi:hypothetical protein
MVELVKLIDFGRLYEGINLLVLDEREGGRLISR